MVSVDFPLQIKILKFPKPTGTIIGNTADNNNLYLQCIRDQHLTEAQKEK